MKIRVKSEYGLELSIICRQLKLKATDGKSRESDCVNTQNLLRLIQSIRSLKAEPFKQWLAKVGYERMQEIGNPEQSLNRARENWQKLGRSEKSYSRELQDKNPVISLLITEKQAVCKKDMSLYF